MIRGRGVEVTRGGHRFVIGRSVCVCVNVYLWMCFDGCIKRGKVKEKWDFGDAEKMSESFRRKLGERLQKNDIQKVYLFMKWTCGISRNEIKEIVLTSFCVKATNPFFFFYSNITKL